MPELSGSGSRSGLFEGGHPVSSPSRGGLQGITLIIPPVSSPTRPYPSVPQLTGYLRRRGIPVRALDANIAFCRHFLQGAELAEGAAYGFDRLRALDGKESLSYAEMVEYLSLARDRKSVV